MLSGAVLFASPLAAAIVATGFPPVSVTVAPELLCPAVDAVERAITRVRGGDPPTPSGAYRLRIGPAGEAIRADLTGADGAAVWSRSFPDDPSATSCASVADAVALIVERHFREVAWRPATVGSGDWPRPGPPDHQEPPLSTGAPGLVVLLGPTYWTRSNGASAALEARARLHDSLQVGLGVMLPPTSSSVSLYKDGSGQVHVTAVPVLASFGLERPVSRRVSLQAAVEGLVTIERGQAEAIAEPATAWRTMLSAGAGVGAAWALGDRLRLDARLSGYRTLLGRPYAVEGIPGTVLDPPAWQGLARVSLGWTFAP